VLKSETTFDDRRTLGCHDYGYTQASPDVRKFHTEVQRRKTMGRFYRSCRKAACSGIATFSLIALTSTLLNAQSAWKMVEDKTGSCQMSVPPNWTELSEPGLVNSPQGFTTMLTSGHRPFRPFSAETIKVMNIDKVFENSPTRIFYAGKPAGNPPKVNYHVEAPGKLNSCIAQITLPLNSEEDAKRIAASLSKTP
jgi:hypothetical protein